MTVPHVEVVVNDRQILRCGVCPSGRGLRTAAKYLILLNGQPRESCCVAHLPACVRKVLGS